VKKSVDKNHQKGGKGEKVLPESFLIVCGKLINSLVFLFMVPF
jgi:hypothetical protein